MTEESEDPKFKALTRDIDWQLYSLLSYIDKGFRVAPPERGKMSPSELVVQNVLDAYLCLAEKFYEQFREQVRAAYQRNPGDSAATAPISDAEVSMLMQQALDKLSGEWARAYGFMAATEAKKTSETERIINQLAPLIRAALRDVGFSPESFPVIPQFGTIYSLGFFNYADDFMALNLPITALKSPWEWTIFWHEIAGQKVRLLKKSQVEFYHALNELFIEMKRAMELQIQQIPVQSDFKQEVETSFRENLYNIYLPWILKSIVPFPQLNALSEEHRLDFNKELSESVYQDFTNSQSSSLSNTRKFIQDLSPDRRSLPILMFSFDDLLDEIMEELRSRRKKLVRDRLRVAHNEALAINKIRTEAEKEAVMEELFRAWDTALSLEDTLALQKKALDEEGWSADWLEELFEDSFSVLNFDAKFLPIFDRLLHRHTDGGKDLRHPPHQIRLATAAALNLLGLDVDEKIMKEDTDLPPDVDGLLAGLGNEQNETLKKFYPGALSADSLAVIWLAAKRFREMHKRIKLPHASSEEAIRQVKEAVADVMSTNLDKLETPEEIETIVNRVLDRLAETGLGLMSPSLSVPGPSQQSGGSYYQTKIDALLKSRTIVTNSTPLDFRELLDLSFYDVDYGTETCTNVRSPWKNFLQVTLLGPPIEVETGTVLYVDSRQKERKTNRQNWNDKAPSAYKL